MKIDRTHFRVSVSTGEFPVSAGKIKFPVSTLVGVFAGILWCVLHRKRLNLLGHFRGHLRVHSRAHFHEHFRERVRGSNFAVRVLCACLNMGFINRSTATCESAPFSEGFQMVFPNGVFQTPHLGLRARKTCSEGQRMPENTGVFKHFGALCPCGS